MAYNLLRPAMAGVFAVAFAAAGLPEPTAAQPAENARPAAKSGDARSGDVRRGDEGAPSTPRTRDSKGRADADNGERRGPPGAAKGGGGERRGPPGAGSAERRGPGGGGGGGGGRGRPTFVLIDPVTTGLQVETLPVYGRVVARQAGEVASRVRGAVGAIRAHVGERVKKGDPLVVLIPDMLETEKALRAAELAEFQAKIRTSEAQLRLAEQELRRLEKLRSSAAFSAARFEDKRREVERVRSTVTESTARAQQSSAQLNMANINLANATIRAPYGGVITRRHTEAGAYLNVGERVVTMTNDEWLEIEAEVPSARLTGLKPGTRVTVDPETSPRFEVVVRAIVPEENQLTRTRTVRFSPPPGSPPATLAVNQSVVLHIPTGAPRIAMTAHKDALLHRRGSAVMFVYDDGKVSSRNVVIGEAFGNRFEIVSGLKPGDQVVTRGNERLRPGQQVMIRGSGPRSGAGPRPGGGKRPGGGDGRMMSGKPPRADGVMPTSAPSRSE